METTPVNLMRRIAWSYHKTTGYNFDELYSEATLAYCEALQKFDPAKGVKPTTFVFTCIQNHLREFLTREKKHMVLTPLDVRLHDKTYEERNFLDSLSPEAYEVAKIILSSPKKYIGISFSDAVKRIQKITVRNGKSAQVEIGIRDLQLAFS